MRRKKPEVEYNKNVNYDALEQHIYDEAPGYDFYACPRCGRDYLATFIIEERGEVMCIDCWDRVHN